MQTLSRVDGNDRVADRQFEKNDTRAKNRLGLEDGWRGGDDSVLARGDSQKMRAQVEDSYLHVSDEPTVQPEGPMVFVWVGDRYVRHSGQVAADQSALESCVPGPSLN
jgi:hypothetical protein